MDPFLFNPYNPVGWSGRVDVVEIPDLSLAPAASEILIEDDPWRISFTVTVPAWPVSFHLWVKQQNDAYGVRPETGQNHVTIHNATFPGAAQWAWFGFCSVPLVGIHILATRLLPLER